MFKHFSLKSTHKKKNVTLCSETIRSKILNYWFAYTHGVDWVTFKPPKLRLTKHNYIAFITITLIVWISIACQVLN